jgi:hypothetical protein
MDDQSNAQPHDHTGERKCSVQEKGGVIYAPHTYESLPHYYLTQNCDRGTADPGATIHSSIHDPGTECQYSFIITQMAEDNKPRGNMPCPCTLSAMDRQKWSIRCMMESKKLE